MTDHDPNYCPWIESVRGEEVIVIGGLKFPLVDILDDEEARDEA